MVEKASIDEAFMQLKPVQPGSGAPLDVPYIRHVAAAVRGAGEQHTVRLTSKLAVRLHHDVRLKKVMNLSSATSCVTYCFQVGSAESSHLCLLPRPDSSSRTYAKNAEADVEAPALVGQVVVLGLSCAVLQSSRSWD